MKRIILLIFSVLIALPAFCQIIINEGSYRNFTQISTADGSNPDWIELYNAGNEPVSLWHFHLSDDPASLLKWTLPDIKLPAREWLLIYASGQGDDNSDINHWETAVRENDLWNWINPGENTSTQWMMPGFNDQSWNVDPGGFGYGDGDDHTEFPTAKVSVYTRISFEISDISKIIAATLHIDYDDGSVAYLNGTEIARANITNMDWNSTADISREAIMFQGEKPEGFDLNMSKINGLIHNGTNLLAVECHNFTAGLIDMSLRTWLSFGLVDTETQFGPLPGWFTTDAEKELHANFKISNGGETIYLSDNNGVKVDQLALPANLPVNSSIGSATDGSAVRAVFMIATPNASNETQTAYTEGFEVAPQVSLPGGFYPDAIDVTLSCTSPDAEIRFTTNSQIPVKTSELYSGVPINIRNKTTLKVRCFSTGHKLPGPVVTASYFIGQNPTPAGILSITMETADLYGETGIYDNWTTDWKKQCYIEYFEPGTHQPVFKQYAGIKIEGGAGGSRSQPQRSFRIEPGNSTLGDGDVQYPLIPARKDRSSYATFYIRNGSNQYLYYPCKDAIETKCMGDSTLNTYAGYTPVQVYLNGYYWGYYELREKLDEDFFKQYSGTNQDSLDILSVSYWYGGTLREVKGTDPVNRFNEDYNRFLSLNSFGDAFWDNADKIFDLEYYTDYICAQTYMADTDWPYNNIRIHRSPQTGSRWRFSLIDLEWSLSPNGWSDSNMDHIRYMLDYDQSYPYVHIWHKAMQNKRFHDYFINRFADLLNSKWRNDRLKGIADEIYNVTRPELPATYKRWGDPNVSEASYMAQFDQAHLTMKSEFDKRSNIVRNHLKVNFNLIKTVAITLNVEPAGSGTIRISTIKPDAYPWIGTYFDGVPVRIEALPNPGFTFSNWDVNALITDATKAVFLDTLTRSAVFMAHFKAATYSEKLVVSEINYKSEPSLDAGDWIEIRNYDKTLSASLNGWYFTDADLTHVFRFPENTIIRPDEYLVIVSDPEKFRTQHPGVPFIGSFEFGLSGSGDAVNLFNYKMELVSAVVFDDEAPWPAGADGQGRTLELRNEQHAADNPANWFDGCIGGSPGTGYTPCNENIVISEINYFSGSGVEAGDWVELRNTGDFAEDISNWVFKDGVDSIGHAFIIPNGTVLGSRKNIVLAQDTAGFLNVHTGFKNITGPFLFGLKDKGEWIRAYDASGRLRLSVRYNDQEPWPVLAGGMGYTLELVDSTGIMNDGTNWMTGCIGGSPGRYYSSDCSGSSISDLSNLSAITVYPNPTSDKINILSNSPMPMRITLKSLLGETLMYSEETSGNAGLSIRHLPAGSYLLVVQAEGSNRQIFRIIRL